jgi:IMP dehydrogenase
MVKLALAKVWRVEDVMVIASVTFEDSTPVTEGVEMMRAKHVTGAPVLRNGRIAGVVSMTDLSAADRRATVGDVMTRVVYAVRRSDSLLLAIKLMVQEQIHRVVVVDDEGRLAGIVTAMDVLKLVAEQGEHELALEYVELNR